MFKHTFPKKPRRLLASNSRGGNSKGSKKLIPICNSGCKNSLWKELERKDYSNKGTMVAQINRICGTNEYDGKNKKPG